MATQPAPETIAAVLSALDVFSGQPDKTSLETANRWLQDFQHTPDAWGTCNYLLMAAETPPSARTFAAQTFRTKVTFDLQQVDPSHRASLRDSLLAALQKYAAGPRVVMIQLCLALAGLAVQMPEWNEAVPSLIDHFGRDPGTVPALLQFLAILPEELNGNTRIPISNDDFSIRASELLTANAPAVVKLLVMYIQAPGVTSAIQIQIFQCLRSWITAGELDVGTLAETPLFGFAFDALASEVLFDVAVDIICDIIHETQEVDDNMAAIEIIVSRLLALKPAISSANDDSDVMRGYCRIFVEAGETYRFLLLQHPESFFFIVEAVAECSAYKDLEIVGITFNFWYRLSLSIGKQATVAPQFHNLFKGLVNVLISHLYFSPDMNPEERDEFRSFRHVMGDTLKDCCYVLGSTACLRTAYDMIVASLARGTDSWQEIEAPLFSMRSMGAEVDPTDDEVVPLIMELIPKLPSHPKVRYAATLVISRYTEWIDRHPQYIQYTLSYISAGFEESDQDVSAASGQAMKYLCKDCKQHLVPYLPQLHTFVQTVSQKLLQEERVQVYEAIAYIISSMPMEEAATALRSFAMEVIMKIHNIISAPTVTKEQLESVSDYIEQVDKMLTVVRSFGEETPDACQNTCTEAWTVLDALILKYGGIHDIAERSSSLIRSGLNFFGEGAAHVVPLVLQRLSSAFESSGFSTYLWVLSKIFVRFGQVTTGTIPMALKASYEQSSARVFEMLKVHPAEDMPDVIEDYSHFLGCVLEFSPDVIFLSPSFPNAWSVVLSALAHYHPNVVYPALEFVLAIVRHDALQIQAGVPPSSPASPNLPMYAVAIRGVVEEQGFTLVGLLLTGLLSHFPEESTPSIVTTFRLLAQYWPQQILTWVPNATEQLPLPLLPAPARIQFVTDFSTAVQTRQLDKVRQSVLDLHRASRRARERTRLTNLDA